MPSRMAIKGTWSIRTISMHHASKHLIHLLSHLRVRGIVELMIQLVHMICILEVRKVWVIVLMCLLGKALGIGVVFVEQLWIYNGESSEVLRWRWVEWCIVP